MFVQKSILLSQHNQEIAQQSPEPFPHERAGSGHKTRLPWATPSFCHLQYETRVKALYLLHDTCGAGVRVGQGLCMRTWCNSVQWSTRNMQK